MFHFLNHPVDTIFAPEPFPIHDPGWAYPHVAGHAPQSGDGTTLEVKEVPNKRVTLYSYDRQLTHS